jgi:hypothetical protein
LGFGQFARVERTPSRDTGLKGKAREVFQRRCLEKSILDHPAVTAAYHREEREGEDFSLLLAG